MKVFQIFYDKKTESQLDESFIPFDNSEPDLKGWYEYSVIRKIFENNSFKEDSYVGVLSPRFFEKTGMRGVDVLKVIENSKSDVISFSPHFDQIAYHKNAFYQGEFCHKGLLEISKKLFQKMNLQINLDALVTDQTRTIFSNYFIAKYSFWRKYLALSEKIYELSHGNSEIAKLLNAPTHYRKSLHYTYKNFIMERLISIILELEDIHAEIGADYTKFLENNSKYKAIYGGLLMLDAFKTAYIKTKKREFMRLYEMHRKNIPLNKINRQK